MDSLSQLLLGGALSAAVAPRAHRRAALLAGAALGTLPDLDTLPLMLLTDDPVQLMTWHRSVTHSLFLLPLLAWAIWWFFRRRGGRVAQAPQAWFWAIFLPLFTHPLLDALTVYGTQIWWPLPVAPAMWGSLFIIDPLYTVWLLLACVVAWLARERALAQQALVAGLALSTAYVGWSFVAKWQVERAAVPALAAMGLAQAPRFSMALPFNTLAWRVVAMTPTGYVIGDRSLLADRGPMVFRAYDSDMAALAAAQSLPAGQRLTWFNRGFMRARVQGELLEVSDLRMGLEPYYSFNFALARRAPGGDWQAIAPQRLHDRGPVGPMLRAVRQRITDEHAPIPDGQAVVLRPASP